MNILYKPIVWAIAGSDNSGGAGIQADNLTLHDFKIHACNIITAVTAQNSIGVDVVDCITSDTFKAQYCSLQNEYPANAIKLGMLASVAIVDVLVDCLRAQNVPVVCDPVCRSSSGGDLLDDVDAYYKLLPFISVLTPNQEEFSLLAKMQFSSLQALESCAIAFSKQYGLDMIITGGESEFLKDSATDLCIVDGKVFWLQSPRRNTKNTHGTGCTLASAIAALLAQGYAVLDAMVLAKAYLNQCLQVPMLFAAPKGPLQHDGFPDRMNTLPCLTRKITNTYTFPRESSVHLGIYPVVDSVEWLERCLDEGIKIIQLRIKNQPVDAVELMIQRACALGVKHQASVYINDYWQLAIQYNAYGVHLGQEDLDIADIAAIAKAGLHLGVSTHSWYELARAHSLRPSYIAIGPIYATTTKVMPFAPQGLQQLKQWVDFIGDEYPLVAIGGINIKNVEKVLATGVGSVAMVRAITESQDYKATIKQLQLAMEIAIARL